MFDKKCQTTNILNRIDTFEEKEKTKELKRTVMIAIISLYMINLFGSAYFIFRNILLIPSDYIYQLMPAVFSLIATTIVAIFGHFLIAKKINNPNNRTKVKPIKMLLWIIAISMTIIITLHSIRFYGWFSHALIASSMFLLGLSIISLFILGKRKHSTGKTYDLIILPISIIVLISAIIFWNMGFLELLMETIMFISSIIIITLITNLTIKYTNKYNQRNRWR